MTKKSKILSVIFFISFIGLLTLSYLVVNGYVHQFDTDVYNLVSSFYQSQITMVAQFVTALGSPKVILALCMIYVAINKLKKETAFLLLNTLLIYVLNLGYRNFIMRAQPTNLHLVEVIGYSFPSEYTSLSVIFYGILVLFISRKIYNKYLKSSLFVLYLILVSMIGLSRIYLGVNYATDVIAGVCLAAVCVSAVYVIREVLKLVLKRKQQHKIDDPTLKFDQ